MDLARNVYRETIASRWNPSKDLHRRDVVCDVVGDGRILLVNAGSCHLTQIAAAPNDPRVQWYPAGIDSLGMIASDDAKD